MSQEQAIANYLSYVSAMIDTQDYSDREDRNYRAALQKNMGISEEHIEIYKKYKEMKK